MRHPALSQAPLQSSSMRLQVSAGGLQVGAQGSVQLRAPLVPHEVMQAAPVTQEMARSQPSETAPLQFAKPLLQAPRPQTPDAQATLALGGVMQRVPQTPQWFGSVDVLTQTAPQRAAPAPHAASVPGASVPGASGPVAMASGTEMFTSSISRCASNARASRRPTSPDVGRPSAQAETQKRRLTKVRR